MTWKAPTVLNRLSKFLIPVALLIGGDFNLPGLEWRTRTLKPGATHQNIHYLFGNIFDDTCLTQMISEPTRKGNTLDLILTNFPTLIPRTEVMPGVYDHDIVFVEFNLMLLPKNLSKNREISHFIIGQNGIHLNQNSLNSMNTLELTKHQMQMSCGRSSRRR